jgi:DNA-binding GntR family transcriptional regulator
MDAYQLKTLIAQNPDAKLKDLVQRLLREEIMNLRIAPGSKLNVNQLAAALGVSRTPVAEAVAGLADEGFVRSHPGLPGSFVQELSLTDMIDLYRVRDAIESEAASLCAHHIGEHTVLELSDLAEGFRVSVLDRDIRGMKETDMPFHRLIVESCGNPYVLRSYELILPRLVMYQASMLEFVGQEESSSNPWMPSVQFNHIAVVSAIRLRLPDLARTAMSEHIANSLSFTSRSGGAADPFLAMRKQG